MPRLFCHDMSTYAISDIHGAYDEFTTLLEKIEFHYDGSDTLYLLGDYADWGEKSIETLLLIQDLDNRYEFVHCLMGNHEAMFLQTADSGYDGRHANAHAANWLYNNRGYLTWDAYQQLPARVRRDLREWIRRLAYAAEVTAGGVTYLLGHAYPYFYDEGRDPKEDARRRSDAVWRRLGAREDPFEEYSGPKHYDCFICGHTISEIYYQELRQEHVKGMKKPARTIRNRVYRADKFIDIDCGAKCLDIPESAGESLQTASMRAQLAALRLEDQQAFYTHRPLLRIAKEQMEMTQTQWDGFLSVQDNLGYPGMQMPAAGLPGLPGVQAPEIRLPSLQITTPWQKPPGQKR